MEKFLVKAKDLGMYGVHQQLVKGSMAQEVLIGVCYSGLVICKKTPELERINWQTIHRLYYKNNKFFIRKRLERGDDSKLNYKFPSHKQAKRFLRLCADHHAFFRLRNKDVEPGLSTPWLKPRPPSVVSTTSSTSETISITSAVSVRTKMSC
ncbi:protein 4.1 [Biomphalaria glabrata]|nr:protein 4.1 [Biomphalaria glabrata]